MKPIPFTLDAFGPDGMLKEGYVVKGSYPLDYVKRFRHGIAVVFSDGSCDRYDDSRFKSTFTMYRRTRTPEEVARDVHYKFSQCKWDDLSVLDRDQRITYVEAGMDEIRGGME